MSEHKTEYHQARKTHSLETPKRQTHQDTKRLVLSEWLSPAGDGRGRDLSGKVTTRPSERRSLPEERRRKGLSEHRKKATEREGLTSWRPQRRELVRTRKVNGRTRGTHFLGTAGRKTCQETKSNQLNEGYSPTGVGKGRYF